MAKKKTNTKKSPKKRLKAPSFKLSNQQKLVLGSFLVIIGIVLCIAFISFFFTGKIDQSTLTDFSSRNAKAENWLSKSGAWLSHFFIQKGFWYCFLYFFWTPISFWGLCANEPFKSQT